VDSGALRHIELAVLFGEAPADLAIQQQHSSRFITPESRGFLSSILRGGGERPGLVTNKLLVVRTERRRAS